MTIAKIKKCDIIEKLIIRYRKECLNKMSVKVEKTENKINVDGSTLCQWLCKCDCGNIVKVKTAALRNGNTKSCGCLQKEKASNNVKDMTNYEDVGLLRV